MSNQLAAFQSLPPRLQQLLLATERPFVRITASRPDAPLPPAASRFGGVGYLPLGTTIPSGPDGDLRLLAQINFAEVNRAVGRVPDLPEPFEIVGVVHHGGGLWPGVAQLPGKPAGQRHPISGLCRPGTIHPTDDVV